MRAIGSRTVPPSRAVTRVAQLGRGAAAEGQHQHVLDRHPGPDPRDHCLDERGRLAGAGAGQHEQRTPACSTTPRWPASSSGDRGGGAAGGRSNRYRGAFTPTSQHAATTVSQRGQPGLCTS